LLLLLGIIFFTVNNGAVIFIFETFFYAFVGSVCIHFFPCTFYKSQNKQMILPFFIHKMCRIRVQYFEGIDFMNYYKHCSTFWSQCLITGTNIELIIISIIQPLLFTKLIHVCGNFLLFCILFFSELLA
jgi:hypothetical protein